MNEITPVALLLLGVIVAVSLWAFSVYRGGRPVAQFLFIPSEVAQGRHLGGLLLSQFAHADIAHLVFNGLTLFWFGPAVELALGPGGLAAIYAASAAGSTLLTFAAHHKDRAYSALGASGAISGVLFAAIVLEPGMSISLGIVPIYVPAPLFAVRYIVVSILAARRRADNIGHEAHLGGAITGLLLAGQLSGDGFRPLIERLTHLFR